MPSDRTPPIPSESRRTPSAAWLALAIVLAGVALWLHGSPLGANETVGGDEGYYGTMARNILADPRQLAGPSLTPLGAPGDKPPLYPALLALSIRVLGPTETALRWPSIAAAALIALALATLLARAAGAGAALAAAALLIALPWFADASRVAAAEPPLAALGAIALAIAAGAPPSRARGFAAGALLGLAFLCKLWLVALLALPVAAALWPTGSRRFAPLALAVLAAIAVAALQLVLVATIAPATLPHWLDVYFRFSLAGRASGGGFTGYWLQPPGYYAALLARALVLHLPLAALGVAAAFRRLHEPVPRALLVWALGAVVLSGFAVKSGAYAYVVMPAWIGLAALGAHSLGNGERPAWGVLALAALIGSPALASRLGDRGVPFAPWLAIWIVALAAALAVRARPRLGRFAAVALTLAVVAGGMAREAQRLPGRYHVPGYRALAAALRPRLADVPPSRACFVAPEAPALAYALFRTGRYWGTPLVPWRAGDLEAVVADTALRAFVVDRERSLYGGWPDSTALAWLETSTRELELGEPAQPARLRLFVRESPASRASTPTANAR